MNSFVKGISQLSKKNKSFLCVGLDSDYELIPFKRGSVYNTILKFNTEIIKATKDLVCCYKLNSAFYEAYYTDGIRALKKSVEYIKNENIPVILDAKREDIGNTAKMYAKYCFDVIEADAVTVLPYMGVDTIDVFREYTDKFVFVVAASSNSGANDFQEYPDSKNPLYLYVMQKCKEKDKNKNTGYVVGATYPEKIKYLREKGYNEIFLIPGIGKQEGDIEKSVQFAFLNGGKGIFNVSRSIIYQEGRLDYFLKVREKAESIRLLLLGDR